MIYLDNGATSFHKPPQVKQAVLDAMERCANPGRGGLFTERFPGLSVYQFTKSIQDAAILHIRFAD